jgi:hypothetical protein
MIILVERKMPTLCGFHSDHYNGLIYVNPAQVRMILPVAEANFTQIVFEKDHQVIVSVPIENVRQELDEAISLERHWGDVAQP